MIGKTISHYKIIEKLGEGGMGTVYKAEDTTLKRIVGLKFLSPAAIGVEEEKTRFMHEAQAAAALSHPNICTIHEIDVAAGKIFIVMEYLEGANLKKKIESGPLKIGEVLDIMIRVAEGLQEAHEKGIIHRDIKSTNIMVSEKGQVKIMDFGLAKIPGRTKVTKTGMTMGTVAYMSPEQSQGKKVDHRTDLWSFGVMLYEMITGQLPFIGEYEQAVVYSIMSEKPEPITGLRTGVPMEMERIVNKCLTKTPEERYQHADELLVDLKKLQQDLKISKKTPSLNTGIQKSSKQRFKGITIYVGIFLLIAIVMLMTIFLSNRIFTPKKTEIEKVNKIEWENSIAVLPFKNISPDLEQEYFCDGMTEQIITNLSRLQRLKVIARTSVMKFKDSKKTIPEIGEELKVAYILGGSVRKAGNRIRVTAQLINTNDGYHLWAKDYDHELKDIFAVQDDVSEAIGNALLEKLSSKEVDVIRTKKPRSTEAYEYFLKAEYFHKKFYHTFQLEDFKISEELFKKAIEHDPNFAPSYAELANLFNTYYGYKVKSKEEKKKYLQLQEKNIEQAMHLDPNSPRVLYIQALVFGAKGENEKRYDCLKKSLQINPNHSNSNYHMGIFLRNLGLVYHSFYYLNKAIESDPLESWFCGSRGWANCLIGEYDKAVLDYKSALQIEPNDNLILLFNIELFIMLKKPERAENLLARFEKIYPDDAQIKVLKAWLMAVNGEKENALKQFEEIKGRRSYKIILYAILDLKDETLELIKALQIAESKNVHGSRYLEYKNLKWYDTLRDHELFREILLIEKERYETLSKKYGSIN
jgi:serine/threonine protein kinase/Tfp pilus assembly protein PilF